MTPEQEQAIRGRHWEVEGQCIRCRVQTKGGLMLAVDWPCDTAVVLAALDALRDDPQTRSIWLSQEYKRERDEARAELDAALRGGKSLGSALAAERDAALSASTTDLGVATLLGECRDERDAALAREQALADALRDAIDVAHETDSLRSHSDDERKDGWFRAPLYRCQDAICEAANAALRAHEEATR